MNGVLSMTALVLDSHLEPEQREHLRWLNRRRTIS
jgi:hypothetical protein